MDARISRAKKLVKLLEKLIEKEHLYAKERIIEMKSQLQAVKREIAELQKKTSKGFGKK
jgi:hypothetical protein